MFQKFRKLLFWLWQQEGTPAQLSRGIAVGVFSGCFPFFGFQTFFGIILASLVKGNRLLAVTGTWISNPFTYVPLYWFNFKIGSYLLDRGEVIDTFNHFYVQELWKQGLFFVMRILLGSTIMGIMLGSISGCICYFLIRVFRYNKNTVD